MGVEAAATLATTYALYPHEEPDARSRGDGNEQEHGPRRASAEGIKSAARSGTASLFWVCGGDASINTSGK